MSELILLCAAAALDRAGDEPPASSVARCGAPARELLANGAFQRLFLRGTSLRDTHDDALLPLEPPEHGWLRERFSVAAQESVEAHSARHHGISLPAYRLTPAHVTIGLDHAMLIDPSQLRLDPQESRALAEAAREVFEDAGFELHAPTPDAWFLHGDRLLELQVRGWRMAAGRNVDAFLPSGADARLWRRLVTEVQMLWHTHEVNLAREAAGALQVNMLWLDGRAQHPSAAPRTLVHSRDPVLLGLASSDAAEEELPSNESLARMARQSAGADLLVEVGGWDDPRRIDDASQWLAAWQRFDTWLADSGLANGLPPGIDAVRAVLTAERRTLELRLQRSDSWRVWRRLDAPALSL